MTEPIVEVSGLRKSFGAHVVLKDLDLSVAPSQVVVVIGPSGSGKSTFLRCLNGLEKAEGGTVKVCGRPVVEGGRMMPEAMLDLLRAEVGMVFQSFNLFPHLTVLDNITLAPTCLRGMSRKAAQQQALQLLEKVGLAHKAKAYPGTLSGGQKQRVAIARALAMEPDILLFDEPTSALDPELTGEVLRTMRALAQERMTMLVVTHEMGFAREVAHRVVFMDQGEIIEAAPSAEFFAKPRHARTQAFLRSML